MPELPEVETMRRGIARWVTGKDIRSLEVLSPTTLDAPRDSLREVVIGHRITGVRRRGKVLLFDLDTGYHLMLHPRMTGQLVVTQGGSTVFAGGHPSPRMLQPMPNLTTRAVVRLDDATVLYFNDQRRFGGIRLLDTPRLDADAFLTHLGPEPDSEQFTVEHLSGQLKRHARAPIKAVLLAQSTVAGLGNIYTDEVLHHAGIHPCRLGGSLTPAEVRRVHGAIRSVIHQAVEDGGTSFADYANLFRGRRSYLAHARVFHRQGGPCPVCGTTIVRIRVAGRGTNLCPQCQPLGGAGAETQAHDVHDSPEREQLHRPGPDAVDRIWAESGEPPARPSPGETT